MAKRGKWEEKARKALKEYNNDSIDLDWIIDIMVQGYKRERDSSQIMLRELNTQEERFKQLHEQFLRVQETSSELKRLEYMIKLYGGLI